MLLGNFNQLQPGQPQVEVDIEGQVFLHHAAPATSDLIAQPALVVGRDDDLGWLWHHEVGLPLFREGCILGHLPGHLPPGQPVADVAGQKLPGPDRNILQGLPYVPEPGQVMVNQVPAQVEAVMQAVGFLPQVPDRDVQAVLVLLVGLVHPGLERIRVVVMMRGAEVHPVVVELGPLLLGLLVLRSGVELPGGHSGPGFLGERPEPPALGLVQESPHLALAVMVVIGPLEEGQHLLPFRRVDPGPFPFEVSLGVNDLVFQCAGEQSAHLLLLLDHRSDGLVVFAAHVCPFLR